jgi:cytoplasmic iron level regulating protein YaaA (DUF328/UPF0246 family)
VLIILPPSESKREAPESGPPVALDELSFPSLAPVRKQVIAALIATSASPEALERLRVRPTLIPEVARNTELYDLPTRPAWETYTGALHGGLDAASLDSAARSRLSRLAVINSAVWGLLRPSDRIPPYRLHVCNHLVGLEDLEPLWRTVVPGVLAEEVGENSVALDLRSPTYQATGTPAKLGVPTVVVRVLPEPGARSIGDVIGKRVRGQLARHLLESESDPRSVDELVDVVAERWSARLEPPTGRLGPWTILVRPGD